MMQDHATFENCPGCCGNALTPKWTINRLPIVACEQCSLVFVKKRFSPAELTEHYTAGHDEVYDDDNAACLAYYYNILKDAINQRLPVKGRVLDVGCAGGWFLDCMAGWDCYGCELSPRDFEIAKKKHGDNILSCDFDDYPEGPELFDVITMQDVFDHLPDPISALEKSARLLRSGGLLVIKVHNISCLYAKLTGPGFYALIPPSHLFYYNKQSLSNIIQRLPFQVVQTKYIGHMLKLKTVFLRLSRGDTNSFAHRLFRWMNRANVGEMKIYKNLHDIITVFAVKQ
jgi:2-polyprenyl-3-methyl-5-hydroxy-6-metoxy-1,4-benzoquinol methylase